MSDSKIGTLPIIYEDEDIVVIDKPIGFAAHHSPGFEGPNVSDSLIAQGVNIKTSGDSYRQGIVHRLDAGTSGLMVVAKTEVAYLNLQQQFRERTVHKTYHAVVQGKLAHSSGTINAPIARHPKERHRFAVVEGGRTAITHYDVIESMPTSGMHVAAQLLEITLETGRTHQIRVHFSALRHSLVGDTVYGANPNFAKSLHLTRQWLHAVKLAFTHPITNKPVSFTSPLPPDLQTSLEALRV